MADEARRRARIAVESVVLVALLFGVLAWSVAVAVDESCDHRPPSGVLGELPEQASVVRNESTSRDCDRYITVIATDGDLDRLEADLADGMTVAGWDLQRSDGWCGALGGPTGFGISLHQADPADELGWAHAQEAHIDVVVFNDASDPGPCAPK